MNWQQVRLRLRGQDAPQVEDLLMDLGAQSITLLDAEDQPLFQTEPGAEPLWDEAVLGALFTPETAVPVVLEQLLGQLPSGTVIRHWVETLQDQDWKTAWMADFHALRFGDRLWICPTWETPPDPSAVNIRLDPGLAFGTGTHPTTALCLAWLDGHSVQDLDVVDYGCGSGVLAIAACLLGARSVLAVDHDPQAVRATATNRDHNGIAPNRLPVCLPEDCPPLQADVILANILAGPLHELAPLFAAGLRPGGALVLSGLIPEQIDALLETYHADFEMGPPVIRDGWVRLDGCRRSA